MVKITGSNQNTSIPQPLASIFNNIGEIIPLKVAQDLRTTLSNCFGKKTKVKDLNKKVNDLEKSIVKILNEEGNEAKDKIILLLNECTELLILKELKDNEKILIEKLEKDKTLDSWWEEMEGFNDEINKMLSALKSNDQETKINFLKNYCLALLDLNDDDDNDSTNIKIRLKDKIKERQDELNVSITSEESNNIISFDGFSLEMLQAITPDSIERLFDLYRPEEI